MSTEESKSTQQKQEKTQQNKYWLRTNVDDILEPMMLATCQANPADTVSPLTQVAFMLKYMEDKYGERATMGDKSTLEFMRNEAARLQAQVDA
jgi:hypothetical protein